MFPPISPPSPQTLLESFLYTARNVETVENDVVECGYEKWSYGDLDVISTGLAIEMKETYGLKPIIATFSENHPYILAVMLATWKLGGVYAPLDHHTPQKLVQHMIINIAPTFVVIPSSDEPIKQLLREMNIHFIIFDVGTTSMTTLTQRFLNQSPDLSAEAFPLPSPSDIALLVHTSSASSISNLKCVPLAHENVFSGSKMRLTWCRKAWPEKDFINLRVLGWAPWSHILGISHDLGGTTFATAGCYFFGVVPSTYASYPEFIDEREGESDVVSRLLDAVIRIKPDMFASVPWVLEGFKDKWSREKVTDKKEVMQDALEKIKAFSCAGATLSKETILWVKDMNISVIMDIGMTELGGPLFYSKADDFDPLGWSMKNCLIPDAELRIVDEDGNEDLEEGELVITSGMISQGYLNFDNSAFTKAPDSRTTFRTGDVYAKTVDDYVIWKGRKDDYIQMVSGETLDPRPIEKALNTSSAILHSCVVGNHFLGKAAEFICVLIEPARTTSNAIITSQITRAVASVNRTLSPPLRIAWSRVLILEQGQEVPYTKKGMIFRKKLENMFGRQVARLLGNGNVEEDTQEKPVKVSDYQEGPGSSNWSKLDVMNMVLKTVASALRMSTTVFSMHSESSFIEFGMDSDMAVRIVNELNHSFKLHLPLNTCHTYLDLVSLSGVVLTELGMNEKIAIDVNTAKPPTIQSHEEVVIVGQALRLPGDINTPKSFWQALIDKRDIMIPIPPDRWDQTSFYRSPSSTAPPQTCDITFEKAGFIQVANFDNNFFGISAPEAFSTSPTIRLTLETAFEALENANIPISRVKGTDMGVFVAGLNGGYHQLLFNDKGFGAYTRFFGTGIASSTACGRLSYLLDVHGPSITVDTACSSGLVVFDQAVKYLQSGDGESAIVCAANTISWPGSFGFLSAQKMASPHSRCATFTSEADGYVPSEGVVAFILKTHSAALRDGDSILAVVKSTDTKHGGRSQGLVSPNVNIQIALQESLLKKAGFKPSEIDFVEAHGTGTSLGDLTEIQGINRVFQHSHSDERPLIVGAAKSCIGHTEIAAGLVGLLKAIASFRHSTIPGLMHLTAENMNSSIDCGIVPMHIPHEQFRLPPKENGAPYRSIVLANGFAGTIAGVVLEAPKNVIYTQAADLYSTDEAEILEDFPMLFVVSAKSAEALTQYLWKYLDFCRTASTSNFRSICYTACLGREHYRYRFACVVGSMRSLIKVLEDRLDSTSNPASSKPAACRIAFAFPGQGSQYQAMASDLVTRYPGFKAILDSAASTASILSRYPISSFLVDAETSCNLTVDSSQVAQICIFVYQYSICTWLKQLGIEPHATLGHSLGEIAAAVIAGSLSYETGLNLVVTRARLLQSDPSHPGGMAIVGSSQERVLRVIHELGLDDRLVIAVYNGPDSHVISGEIKAIDTFISVASIRGFRATKVKVDQGFHSPCISSALPALQEWLNEHHQLFTPLNIAVYSTVYGKEIREDQRLGPDYWVEHAREPVRFSDAAEALYSSKSIDIIVDIGPQPLIWTTLQSYSRKNIAVTATCGKRSNDQNAAFLSAIASLFELGITPDFGKLLAHKSQYGGHMSSLPTYPFQRQRYYPTNIPSRNIPSFLPPFSQPKPSSPIRFNVDQSLCDLLLDHKIEGHRVAPGASLVDFFANLCPAKSVKTIKFNAPLVLDFPESDVFAEFTSEYHFAMYENNSRTNMVCSGIVASEAPQSNYKQPINLNPIGQQPDQVLTKDEVYERIKSVEFGSAFRSIQECRRWSSHAECVITVEPTEHPAHDRIRKLDSCLHMFGALAFQEVPQTRDLDGTFLPTSLENFTLHSDKLPTSFICRYYLPFDISHNSHVISAAFDVFSLSGALLVSCRKYSVAWIPAGIAVRDNQYQLSADIQWLQQSWVARDLPPVVPVDELEVLCIIDPAQSRILSLFNQMAWKTHVLIPQDLWANETLSFQLDAIIDRLTGTNLLVVVDVTSSHASPTSETFCSSHRRILTLMKLLISAKARFTSLVFISEMSVAVGDEGERLPAADLLSSMTPTAGSVIQGMLRVFRREMGLDEVIWALDLPPMNTIEDGVILGIISNEIYSRLDGLLTDRTVAYRIVKRTQSLSRLVPVLQTIDHHPIREVTGTSVIVGLGSIGHALAPPLAGGHRQVVFIGRRHPSNREVQKELLHLQSKTDGHCAYMQADVCDFDSLRSVIIGVQTLYGPIENIVHTAAVVSDATTQTVTDELFDLVLRPKVIGAWNLHVISEELKLPLKSFVLLSSVSVPLGNQGQIAYVAGNAYMETLASYRHSLGLPATCLQLGAWESKLVQTLAFSTGFVRPIKHEKGIPLLLKAMLMPIAVQVIADFDIEKLASVPAYAQDPLFYNILGGTALTQRKASVRGNLTKDEVTDIMLDILRTVLELRPSEHFEPTDSLTSCGIDSISFAQIRGRVLNRLEVEIPMMFLSDSFTVNDVVSHVVDKSVL